MTTEREDTQTHMTTITTATYEVGERVIVNYCEPGSPAHEMWSGPATVISDNESTVSVASDKLASYGPRQGAFVKADITPLFTSTTAEDMAGVYALPAGTIVEDIDGDEYIVSEDGRFLGTVFDFDLAAPGMESYLPLVVLNPEHLDEVPAIDIEPLADWEMHLLYGHTFRVGDRVRHDSDATFTGTVAQEHYQGIGGDILVRWDAGSLGVNEVACPTRSSALSLIDNKPEVVSDSELVGATVERHDGDVLDSLPVGSVIKRHATGDIRFRTVDGWMSSRGDAFDSELVAACLIEGATVLHIG